ncbi:MAG: CapA family protein [Candidatus Vogelbacteria bacterium]|nr:CapA family protein [Candidatus Vogelbacteria bacterium]
MHDSPLRQLLLTAVVALVVGFLGSYAVFDYGMGFGQSIKTASLENGLVQLSKDKIIPGRFVPISFRPPKVGKMIGIDLSNMELTLFQNALARKSYKIVSKGAVGSPWETPVGNYKILTKRQSHLSPIAHVRIPWAMQFFGNSFIHGDPVEGDMKSIDKVRGSVGLGSIHLLDEDAIEVYKFTDIDTPVSVIEPRASHAATLAIAELGDVNVEFKSATVKPPKLTSLSYIVQDLSTGQTLLEKNPEKILPIASVSKLMTAAVATEILDTKKVTTVSPKAALTFGSAGYLKAGERFIINELFYPLLLESSNKAAEVLSEVKDREAFILAMNNRANVLDMKSTHYDDPSGLDPRNVSTAGDLLRLTKYLLLNKPEIFEITNKTKYKSKTSDYIWSNHNKLVINKESHYLGGKTGYIPESGQTSVALFNFPAGEFIEKQVAVVLLKSYNRDADTRAILRYLKDSLFYDTGVPVNDDDIKLNNFSMLNATTTGVANLVSVGNIQIDQEFETTLKKRNTTLDSVLSNSYFIKNASVSVANLLGPVTTVGYQVAETNAAKTSEASVGSLAKIGLDALLLANNHSGDWGRSGLKQTVENVEKHSMASLGAGEDIAKAQKIYSTESNGVKIGILGVSTESPAWLQDNKNLPVVMSAHDPIVKQSIEANSQKYDQFVVAISYDEKKLSGEGLKNLLQSYVDVGATVVLGFGPHRPGPIEKYKSGVIVYSLGDYLLDSSKIYEAGKDANGMAVEIVFNRKNITAVNAENILVSDSLVPVLTSNED